MLRSFALISLGAAGLAVIAFGACNASTTEGCLTGPCTSSVGAGGAPVMTTATSTGTGGAGGKSGCPTDTGVGGFMCTPPPATGDYPCEVFKVVHKRCHLCHNGDPDNGVPTDNGAPFSLLQYEKTQALYGPIPIWQDAERVIQPAAVPHMPFGMAPQLTCDEKKILDDYFRGCGQPVAKGTGCFCPDGWKPGSGDKGNGCTDP